MHPTLRTTLASGILLLGSLAIMPTAHAVNADWTVEYANSLTDGVREIAVAHSGEKMGMAYRNSANNGVGFSIRSMAGVWTEMNHLAVVSATNLDDLKLVNTGTSSWVIFGLPVGHGQINSYTSTDDGATWTAHAALLTSTIVAYDVASITSSKIGILYCDGAVADYVHSLDGGASLAAGFAFRIDDNVGSPTATSATAVGCISTGDVALSGDGSGQAYAIFSKNNAGLHDVFWVQSTGGNDAFWTVPYYNGGACPTGCSSVDGATTPLAYIHNGFAAGYFMSFPQNGDLIHTLRNANAGCVPRVDTAKFSATYLGLPASDSTGAVCDAYTPSSGAFTSSTDNSCTGNEKPTYSDRIAGNSAHTFITAYGHTTLCSAAGFEIRIKTGVTGSWAQTYNDLSQTNIFDVDMTATRAYAAFVDSTSGGQVKVVSASAPTAAPALGAAATVAVTGLVGFDVDPSGVTAIARTNGGATVRAYGASTLTENANTGTNCNLAHGVMAISDHVAYFHCSSGSTIDSLNINSPILGPPTQPDDCLQFPGGICPYVITNADIIAPDGHQQIQLNGITDFPIDFSRPVSGSTGQASGNQNRAMAFAFSTSTGDIGVSIINQWETGGDTTSIALANIGEATQPVDEMCVTRDLDGKTYIYAVSTLTNAKAWRVDFHKVSGGVNEKYAPSLVTVFPGTAGTAGANGVACGLDHFAILKSGSLTIWHCRATCTNAAVTISGLTGTTTGGIAMADDGKTVSYIANTTSWYIRNTTSGATLGSGPTPTTGTFKAMKEQGAGSSLWIASSLEIDRYPTFSVVGNGTDQAYTPPCHGASDTCTLGGSAASSATDTSSGVFGVDATTVPAGFTVATFNGFLGLLMVSGVSAGGYFTLGRKPFIAGAFAVVGMFMAFFFGLLPLWVLILVGVIGIAVAFLSLRSKGG